MEKQLTPIRYDKDWYSIMANDIIRGKQKMTLQEARIIHLVVTQVAQADKDLKTYSCNIRELSNFLGISISNMYRDIRGICSSLMRRYVSVGTGNPKEPWEMISWISYAKYDGQGGVTLRLSDEMKKYVLALNEYFTKYKLENVINLDSFYGLRLYQLIKSDDYKSRPYLEYSIEFLREFFNIEENYKRIVDFKKHVINVATKAINKNTDLEIREVEYIKEGRTITSIRFYVFKNVLVLNQRERNRQVPGQITLSGETIEDVKVDYSVLVNMDAKSLG